MEKDLHWIDAVKAICMISVYLLHSEAYYGTGGISYGFFLQPFYVNAFFFVSGYLMFRKYMPMLTSGGWYSVGLANLFFRLIVPTLLFSSVVFLPKMLFHGETVSMSDFACRILGGTSFWFTSCLAVAQFIVLSLFLTKQRNMGFYLVVSILLAVAAVVLRRCASESPFPWYYQSGMLACLFMSAGGVLYRYESLFESILKKKLFLLIGGGIGLALLLVDYQQRCFSCAIMGCKVNAAGLAIAFFSIAVLISFCYCLPRLRLLRYIGRQSIVFYFFFGVCPALFGTLLNRFLPIGGYGVTLLCCLLSLVTAYILCYVIHRWMPWLLDVRKLKIVK